MEIVLIVSFYSNITNAELIIRIRCLVTFERKGNVHIFFLLLRIYMQYMNNLSAGKMAMGMRPLCFEYISMHTVINITFI